MASSEPGLLTFDFSKMRPSSPPATPLSRTFSSSTGDYQPAEPTAIQALYDVQSPPPHHSESHPTEDTSRIRSIRVLSSSPSSSSAISLDSTSKVSTRENRPEASSGSQRKDIRTVRDEDFTVEEILDGDVDYISSAQVLRPDHYEDPDSDWVGDKRKPSHLRHRDSDLNAEIIDEFESMRCKEDEQDSDGHQRRYRRKRQRWSAGKLKRSHSQSVGSNSETDSDEEILDAHDVASSARRLRRRVRGPGDRGSLLVEEEIDPTVAEIEEPAEEASIIYPKDSPAESGAGNSGMEALPFWVMPDPMDIDPSEDA
ncbi:MAG: hypothetical protein M1836_000035 [Candelina mexicana]|nr:MAG: hypothetical protein M1836_000035 [Candelina mexicana]